MDILNERASEVMKKAMDGLAIRHKAISSNLANVDTPGYKPIKVEFEDKLRIALENEDNQKRETAGMKLNHLNFTQGILDLKTSNPKHLGSNKLKLHEIHINAYKDDYIQVRNDSNGVDIDTEMAELAKNSMKYEALATLQAKHFMGLKEVIKGSGGS